MACAQSLASFRVGAPRSPVATSVAPVGPLRVTDSCPLGSGTASLRMLVWNADRTWSESSSRESGGGGRRTPSDSSAGGSGPDANSSSAWAR